jgi:hypothetical protein
MSAAHQGAALMQLARRRGDASLTEAPARQIDTAPRTMVDTGYGALAACDGARIRDEAGLPATGPGSARSSGARGPAEASLPLTLRARAGCMQEMQRGRAPAPW